MKLSVLMPIFICALTISPLAFAFQPGWSISAGLLQNNMYTLTQDKTAKRDIWGETYLPLGAQYSVEIMPSLHFVPSVHTTHITSLIIPKETPDKGAIKNISFISLPLVQPLATWLEGKLGVGIFQYEIKGKGGTIQLDNGTGTSEFYKPNKTRTSRSTYIIIGAGFPMTGWHLDLDFIINGALSEERRSYNMSINFVYPLSGP